MGSLFEDLDQPGLPELITLGLHHEEQHQELLLMDIKHVLSKNPLHPAYVDIPPTPAATHPPKAGWLEHDGGPVEIGHRGDGFGFDNEFPVPSAPDPVRSGRPPGDLWGVALVHGGRRLPPPGVLALRRVGRRERPASGTHRSTGPATPTSPTSGCSSRSSGLRPVDPDEPVCHVSYYEADAFAHWTGMRLPTESEWETIALRTARATTSSARRPRGGAPASAPRARDNGLFGDTWEWTSSAYSPYPGFRAPRRRRRVQRQVHGQPVRPPRRLLRHPGRHVRATYRNFFPPGARWPFSGVRLARIPDRMTYTIDVHLSPEEVRRQMRGDASRACRAA